jgi:hypothetical protein
MLEQAYQQVHEQFRSALAIYFEWYVFFWTLNLAALAWIYAKPREMEIAVLRNRRLIAWLFVGLNALGTCSCLIMIPFTNDISTTMATIAKEWSILEKAGNLSEIVGQTFVPHYVLRYAFLANAASTVGIALVWYLLGRRDRSK